MMKETNNLDSRVGTVNLSSEQLFLPVLPLHSVRSVASAANLPVNVVGGQSPFCHLISRTLDAFGRRKTLLLSGEVRFSASRCRFCSLRRVFPFKLFDVSARTSCGSALDIFEHHSFSGTLTISSALMNIC
jgi:glycerol-3-phosphate O-acyltransferase